MHFEPNKKFCEFFDIISMHGISAWVSRYQTINNSLIAPNQLNSNALKVISDLQKIVKGDNNLNLTTKITFINIKTGKKKQFPRRCSLSFRSAPVIHVASNENLVCFSMSTASVYSISNNKYLFTFISVWGISF